MTVRLLLTLTGLAAGLCSASAQERAATVSQKPVLQVVRSQVRAIAENIVEKLEHPVGTVVLLRVKNAPIPEIVENSFLEVLQEKGLTATLAGGDAAQSGLLEVYVLGQSVTYEEARDGFVRRQIRSAVEAKYLGTAEGPARYLGLHENSMTDMVEAGEAERSRQALGPLLQLPSPGIVERILTPMVVIAGALIIVYLFFTVRS